MDGSYRCFLCGETGGLMEFLDLPICNRCLNEIRNAATFCVLCGGRKNLRNYKGACICRSCAESLSALLETWESA